VGYEKAVQQAFREVLDALVAQRQSAEIGAANQRRASALARTLELADLRYRNGVDNYLQVLDAQRNLYQAQQSAIDARRAQLAASADLIKALGGGWNGAVADNAAGAFKLQLAPSLAMPGAQ
jgi:multidrug efflux system outer membrane protein